MSMGGGISKMLHNYYSIYSSEYLHKGLVLYNSMKKYDREFRFYVICFDDTSKELLDKMNLENLISIRIKDIEAYDSEMASVRPCREDKTYTWLVKPVAALYLFDIYPDLDHLLWLDGDMEFKSDPQSIYDEWGDYSVLLTIEGFTDEYFKYSLLYGYYNTGLLGFKRDSNAFECLKYYREKLIVCNFDDYIGSWNDQLYVTDWPQRFNNIGVVKNPGINLTPFITFYRNYHDKGWLINKRGDGYYLHDSKITLYHYMAVKYINADEFDLCRYVMDFNEEQIKHMYLAYLKSCRNVMEQIKLIDEGQYYSRNTKGRFIRNYFNLSINETKPKFNLCTVVNSDSLDKCLELYKSLLNICLDFQLWICCMDERSYDYMDSKQLNNVILIDVKNLEDPEDEDLISAKNTMDEIEYICIIKPLLIHYIMKNNYNINGILYISNDYDISSSLFGMYMNSEESIIILPNASQNGGVEYGKYNSDLMWFKRDKAAFEYLKNWREKCKLWCSEKKEGNGRGN